MIFLALMLFLAGQQPGDGSGIDYFTARSERRLHPIKTTERITVDGRIDEPVWEKAAVADGFIQNEPDEGRPATEHALVQYNNTLRQWSSNIRFNIIHRPLSD